MSEGERRLAAIMYTDIVGYTSLTQKDESYTLQALETHRSLLRPLFTSHGGREIKTIGDAFLVEFQSALNAVLCAVAIQQVMHDRKLATGETISLRIGIHVGDVVERGNDILGDAVNVASRIEPLAEPGGVCISSQVYEQVRNKSDLPFVSLGEKSLKNVSTPVVVYAVRMPWEQTAATQMTTFAANRIAILPFRNMSPDPNDEYFAEGMTEEIISTVSGISGLNVISRTSVMQYKKTDKTVKEIGRELEVGSVLEGSLRKAGNRIRVTTQLIEVAGDKHLWAQNYDRNLDDIFEVQSDIAKEVAESLRVRVLSRESNRLEKKPTENIEAYTLYLKGRIHWNKRNKEGVLESLKLFKEAIRLDPNYARAYAGLADAYSVGAQADFTNLAEGMSMAKEAATKALELDDSLAEAHASLGLSLSNELKYEDAQREFRRAIELNPSYASAHQWYGGLLMDTGRREEATEEIERAHQLDPLSPVIGYNLAATKLCAGNIEETIAILDKLIEDNPSYSAAYSTRGFLFAIKGMKERAYADLEAWHKLFASEDAYRLTLFECDLLLGNTTNALPIIEGFIQKVGEPYIWETDIADCYAILGNKDEFFKWVDKAITAKRVSPTNLRFAPIYDKVRGDPRFRDIFKKLGLTY